MNNQGLITVGEDAYGRSREFTAFVYDPGKEPICQINGITQFDIAYKFNDISSINFEVSRYIENATTHAIEENLAYIYLHSFCEIYVPELGKRARFIINEEPQITADGTRNERKAFTAMSYESTLMYENLVLFDINQGTETSRETWEETGGESMYPEPIRLFYPEKPSKSLLHLVLEDDYFGWSIGHVDLSLASLQRSFSIDNKNKYAFLKEDLSVAFRCIIEFNTVDKLLNVYDIETIGSQSNIYLGFENFVNQVSLSPATSEIYTCFNVQGADGLGIEWANFGSNKIYDITYPLSLADPLLAYKWSVYSQNRESLRQSYSDIAIHYADLQSQYNSIMDRQPDDTVNNNWSSPLITLEELQQELDYATWYVNEIEAEYTDEHGVVDTEAIDLSPEAGTYYSFLDIVIPDVTAEITARQAAEPYTAERVNQEYVWGVYGINDLIDEQRKLTESIQLYIDREFDDPVWDPSKKIDEDSYYAQHQAYLDLVDKKDELDDLLTERYAKRDQLLNQMESYTNSMTAIAQQVSIESNTGSGKIFTEDDAAKIKSMFRESDYTDENYLITEYDDTASEIATQLELYAAAEKRLAIESRPQLAWSVSTADLFNIEEFKPLRNDLQLGDFIILGFKHGENVPISQATFKRMDDGSYVICCDDGTTVTDIGESYVKLRCVEFDFSGLKTDTKFEITFSTSTSSKYQNDDYESLLGDYLTSKANSITVRATTTASEKAGKVASSLVRPYIQIMRAQIDEAKISKATVEELQATYGHFQTIVAEKADIDLANVGMIQSRDGDPTAVPPVPPSSYWNLDTGELCLSGYVIRSETEYALSNSTVDPPGSGATWSTTKPIPGSGQYVWQRAVLIDGAGDRHPGSPVCIEGTIGPQGETGEPATVVTALSSLGTVFKNESSATDIDVTVIYGSERITTLARLRAVYGNTAKIVWKTRAQGAADYTTVPDGDSRISNNGFRFTMSPANIVNSISIIYEVWA